MPAKIKIGNEVYETEKLELVHTERKMFVRHVGYYKKEQAYFELIEFYKLNDNDWLCVEYEWLDGAENEKSKVIKALYSCNTNHIAANYIKEEKP